MTLPADFVKQFLEPVSGITILGASLSALTKKELQATVVFLIAELEEKKDILSRVPTYQSYKTIKGH